jgi:hypothetical protein
MTCRFFPFSWLWRRLHWAVSCGQVSSPLIKHTRVQQVTHLVCFCTSHLRFPSAHVLAPCVNAASGSLCEGNRGSWSRLHALKDAELTRPTCSAHLAACADVVPLIPALMMGAGPAPPVQRGSASALFSSQRGQQQPGKGLGAAAAAAAAALEEQQASRTGGPMQRRRSPIQVWPSWLHLLCVYVCHTVPCAPLQSCTVHSWRG